MLTSLSPQELRARLSAQDLDAAPQYAQPAFLQFSADYLSDNMHLLDALGYPDGRVRPVYVSARDDGGRPFYLPLLELRARRLRLNLVPGPRAAIPVLPQPQAQLKLLPLIETYSGSCQLYFAEQHPGWQLDGSLFSLFAGFSAAERKLMSHSRHAIRIDLPDDAAAGWTQLEALRQDSLQNKRELKLPLIYRDHQRLRETWPTQLRLARIQVDDQLAAVALWTEHDDEAILAELVGDATFRRDEVAPLAVFGLLKFLRARGLRRLLATRYEWFLPAIWSMLMDETLGDNDKLRHQRKSWEHLEQRGMKELGL